MCVVDAYDGGDSGFVILTILWNTHSWSRIHNEGGGGGGVGSWEGKVRMVCVSGKELNCVCWLSQSICCVMIIEMLDEFSCAAMHAHVWLLF